MGKISVFIFLSSCLIGAKPVVRHKPENYQLALAFSDAWTFTVLKDRPSHKKIIFYPKDQSLRSATARIEEQRILRPRGTSLKKILQHTSNSFVGAACRPIEAGEFRESIIADATPKTGEYLGLRCRREKSVKVIRVFDAGKYVYILSFWSKQTNWADKQFKSMNEFLKNRAYLCPAVTSDQCNESIQKHWKPSEFDTVGGGKPRWPGQKMPRSAYIL